MANQKLVELNLGLLNSAQDPTGIKDFEGSVVSSLDIDQLALGTLESSDYFSVVEGSYDASDSAVVAGAEFALVGENLAYKNIYGDFIEFNNVFGTESVGLASLTQSEENIASATISDDMDGKLLSATVDAIGDYRFSLPEDYIDITVLEASPAGATNTINITNAMNGRMTAVEYDSTIPYTLDTQTTLTISVEIESLVGDGTVLMHWHNGVVVTPPPNVTYAREGYVTVIKGQKNHVVSGVNVTFDVGAYPLGYSGTVVIDFQGSVSIGWRSKTLGLIPNVASGPVGFGGGSSGDSLGSTLGGFSIAVASLIANSYIRASVTKGVSSPIGYGVYITLDAGEYVVNEKARLEMRADDLTDGDYAYAVQYRAVANSTLEASNGDKPTLAPSASKKITIRNFNSIGDRVTAKAPQFEVVEVPNYEAFVYRRDEAELDFFQLDQSKATQVAATTFVDTIRIVEMDRLDKLEFDDESEDALNESIGNASEKYVKIFSKDNRLFRVPKDRQDLLLYSRAGAWWGWRRENSFAFDSNIVAFSSVRDPSTVGGVLTTVIFTETGMYHLTGTGTEADPYTLSKQIDGVVAEPASIVNMNGVLMFTTKSVDGSYNKGPYGQKVYEYDLQKLVEVSARIQNNSTLLSSAPVQYAEMLGGDKYFVKKTGVDDALVYHRDAQGWAVSNLANETAGAWVWKSKDFTPTVMRQFKIGYARKFKLDFVGQITIKFTVWYDSRDDEQTYELTLNNASRGEVINHLPPIQGTIWNFEISGNNAFLYNMYLIR